MSKRVDYSCASRDRCYTRFERRISREPSVKFQWLNRMCSPVGKFTVLILPEISLARCVPVHDHCQNLHPYMLFLRRIFLLALSHLIAKAQIVLDIGLGSSKTVFRIQSVQVTGYRRRLRRRVLSCNPDERAVQGLQGL